MAHDAAVVERSRCAKSSELKRQLLGLLLSLELSGHRALALAMIVCSSLGAGAFSAPIIP
ncbi:hypothetical protein [Steroidobacter agaridevorans]|uniref:hypothetical protein n=1 Tax=Steroidobacter agaridevorans TaxID=2695856 RepID=UPI00132193E7|nr:hypothetical protein [Steroidobacter agaridevorans]GFE86729.1 hypothetical protein GCM10011488_16830 [Steroidobacter agaridevorans]